MTTADSDDRCCTRPVSLHQRKKEDEYAIRFPGKGPFSRSNFSRDPLVLSAATRVWVAAESDQLTQLLGEARIEAGELAKDADETESLIRSDVSWQTHASLLEQRQRACEQHGSHH